MLYLIKTVQQGSNGARRRKSSTPIQIHDKQMSRKTSVKSKQGEKLENSQIAEIRHKGIQTDESICQWRG